MGMPFFSTLSRGLGGKQHKVDHIYVLKKKHSQLPFCIIFCAWRECQTMSSVVVLKVFCVGHPLCAGSTLDH